MFDSVSGAIGLHFQRFQVFHAHVQQLQIFEQRDPHLSQLESHKQDSSYVPITINRGSINWEMGMAKGLAHHAQSIVPQKWHSGTPLTGEERAEKFEFRMEALDKLVNSLAAEQNDQRKNPNVTFGCALRRGMHRGSAKRITRPLRKTNLLPSGAA
ncbi:hypothetical protein AVEN_165392-1 [Araneus ventricosus]|uniref:Uncharacterized protein n=1 Tax=Araneus ventricosus TaxID=182803 RepID=A0A4Y2AT54_ARAVE|nr:hypothetical protein AVEN_165392-1 [Araneus ventricosus]